MIVFGIIFVIACISGISYYLYTVLKEQREIIDQTRDENDKIVEPRKIKAIDLISDGNFSDLLSEAKNNPMKLEELRRNVQSELRKAVKERNISKSRTCNEYLKKIDEVERGIQS